MDQSSHPMTTDVTHLIETKWLIVKEFYESTSRVRFKHRLSDDKIEWLYDQMKRLGMTEQIYQKKEE